MRALAADVGVGAGTSARVLELLDREGLVSRTDTGEVELVRKKSLVRRWSQDYGLMTSHEIVPMIDPRGIEHALSELRDLDDDYVMTGSSAARAYLPTSTLSAISLTLVMLCGSGMRMMISAIDSTSCGGTSRPDRVDARKNSIPAWEGIELSSDPDGE